MQPSDSKSPQNDSPGHGRSVLDVLVIGAGFSGICIGIRLLKAGIRNFCVYEKALKVGGTWHYNDYPGAACDVLSHFYCYSFEPKPDWSRRYSGWREIQAYAEHCTDKYGLRPYIRPGQEVQRLEFEDRTGLWRVWLSGGERVRTRHVVDGSGGLHVPYIPSLPGRECFAGEQWHSSQWRHDISLAGKCVAVIGSAASAVQIVPEIAKQAGHVILFQRTANYVIPRHDRAYRPWEKWCFRNVPAVGKLYRLLLFLRYEWLAYPIVKTRESNLPRRQIMRQFKKTLRKQVASPEMRAKLTPDYPIGCKRILISDDFYPSLNRENVTLAATGIESVTKSGAVGADGSQHDADVLVYATGFDTQGFQCGDRVVGPGGRSLASAWSDAPTAYQGAMVAGFPNYYFVTGPNTGVGSTSVIFMIEQQANFIMACIRAAGPDGLIAPRAEAMEAYDREIQRALATTVWAGDCDSWYKRADGRITALYPYNATTYRRRHRKIDLSDFELVHGPTR